MGLPRPDKSGLRMKPPFCRCEERSDEAISVGTGEWRKIELPPFSKNCYISPNFNGILTFRCYTLNIKEKKDRIERTQGIRLIDKDWEIRV